MNLYNSPNPAKAELVLAEIWRKSAREEGHHRGLPRMPQEITSGKHIVTDDERDAAVSALRAGRRSAREVAAFMCSSRNIASTVLAELVEDGIASFKLQAKRNELGLKIGTHKIFPLSEVTE